jgi:predicted transcriptional regulator
VDPDVKTVDLDESIDQVSQLLSRQDFVVVLTKQRKPLGIITSIDLIDYFSHR